MSNKPTPVSFTGKHVFTQEERDSKLQQMLTTMRSKEEIEAEAKTSSSTYKAKINAKEAEIKLIANLLNAGKEDRNYQCNLVLNFELTRREYFEVNTNELVGTEPLTAADYQTQLALDEQMVKEQNEQHTETVAFLEDNEHGASQDPDYSVDPFSDPMEMQEQPADEPAIEETPPAHEATVVNIDKPTKKEAKPKTVEIEPTTNDIEDDPFALGDDEDNDAFDFNID